MQVDIRTRADSVATHRRRRGKGSVRQPLPAPLAPSGKPDSWWRAQVRPRSPSRALGLRLAACQDACEWRSLRGMQSVRVLSPAGISELAAPLPRAYLCKQHQAWHRAMEVPWCGAQVGSPVVERAWETLCGSIIQEVRPPLPSGARTITAQGQVSRGMHCLHLAVSKH